MQVLPIFPLYPSFDFMTYNPSLGIPGPRLYDIPLVGKYAQENGFPNTKSSVLFPDVEYIKKFAQYELGIGRAIQDGAKNGILAKTNDPELKSNFENSFNSVNSNDSMGLVALERSIISTIFEEHKPYFIIAQFAIENIIKIEDIIARVCPLLGAAINPPMALAIKSRKPTVNGPSEDNPLGLSKYGMPPAMGFKGAEEIQSKLNDVKTIAKKGLNIEIKKGGKFDSPLKSKLVGPSFSVGGDYAYDYITVSVAYSTGTFDKDVNYVYKYIDIPAEKEPNPVGSDIPTPDKNLKPERIVFGIFDSSGSPINPKDKLKTYVFNDNNETIVVDSIYEKASWIYQTKKWIFNSSVKNPNMFTWEILDREDYVWKNSFGDVRLQHDSPGSGFERLKYKDVIDFNIPENQAQKFKEDDFVTSFTQSSSVSDYKKYYESITEIGLNKAQIEADEKPEIKREIEKLYDDKTINEQLQNLFKFGKLKSSYYDGVDSLDWEDNPPSTTFPDALRRVFKPMEFRIAGETVWIDPELDYDFKIIRVDTTKKIDFKPKQTDSKQGILGKSDSALNKELITDELYSKGKYGVGFKGGETKDDKGKVVGSVQDNPMKVGYIRRSKLTELDNETYFIIEGIRRDLNKTDRSPDTSENTGENGNGGDGSFYFLFDAIGIIPIVIELAIDLFTRFFPEINKLISLIKNPAGFVSEIITLKVSDPNSGFSVFSDESKNLLSELDSKSKSAKGNLDDIEQLKNEVKQSQLGNYIFVNDSGDYKFLLDGPAVIDFFGIAFGIKVNFSNSLLPISPILGADFSDKNSLKNFLNEQKVSKITDQVSNFSDNTKSVTNIVDNAKINQNLDKLLPSDIKSKGQQEALNYIVNQSGTRLDYQDISVFYPKGIKTDVDYKFVYTDDKIGGLITEADELSSLNNINNSEDSIKILQDAQSKYQQAIDLEKSKGVLRDAQNKITGFDPSKVNQPLISSIQSKMDDLKSKMNIISQPIFKMILGLATTPLKVVLSIIKKLIDLFKNMLNPFTMPQAVVEFLSFQWILEYFTPIGLLKLAGVDFDPRKAIEWCIAVNVPNPLYGFIPGMTEYIIPDDYPIADLSQFLDVSFMTKLPTYNAKQYRELCLLPFRWLTPFLCFFEKIINAFIMLIWSIMGITAVIPPPLIKLCDKLNENIKPEDAMDLVNGLYKPSSVTSATSSQVPVDGKGVTYSGDGSSYNFIYEVQLEDGTIVKNLDTESLQKYINDNKNLDYDFANFSTIQ